MAKSSYRTKQMAELLELMKSQAGRHLTVHEICGLLEEKGASVGMTTVYRNLEKLVDQGIIAKYTIDGTTSACFEYVPEKGEKQLSYHCKCEKCGRLIHLRCDEVKGLQQHMAQNHGFTMDPLRTVFYGICSDCAEAEQ